MNEQKRLNRRARELRVWTAAFAILVALFHALLTAATDGLGPVLVLFDLVLVIVATTVAWRWIELETRSRQRSAALAVIPRELASPRSIEEAAGDSLAALHRAGVVSAAAIGLAGSAAGEMRLAASAGFPAGFEDSAMLMTLPPPDQLALAVEDPLDHPWARELAEIRRDDDVTATAPLVVGGGDSLGLLLLAAPQDSILDVPLVTILAEQVASVIDHAALYEASFQRERDLEAQEERRREFMSAISHEIRTPLTSIQAFAEILHADPAGVVAGAGDLVPALSQSVARLRTLVDELIELGRGAEWDERAQLRAVDVAALLTSAVSVVRPAMVGRQQVLTLDLPPAPLLAFADSEYLQHVVLNLLSNANRHTPERGSILLRAGVPGPGRVRIEVTDSGPGVAAADRQRVFEPYYRVQRSATHGAPGAGLGLAIARRFTELQGGRIWVDAVNGDGSGARFSVELAAAEAPAPPAAPTISAGGVGRADATTAPAGGVDRG